MANVKLAAPLPKGLIVAIHESAPASPWTWGGDRYWRERRTWRISLAMHNTVAGPFYWTGAAGQGKESPPTPEDVMLSLAQDASCAMDCKTVEDFAAKFGPRWADCDEAQRVHHRETFRACKAVASDFTRLGLDPSAPCFQEA